MLSKKLQNEEGFVLIVSLMMLVVLMIIGIAATNTTTIELQISGNDKSSTQTFYQAEAVTVEAMQIFSSIDDLADAPAWMLPSGTGVFPAGAAAAAECTAMRDNASWTGDEDGDGTLNSNPSAAVDGEMITVHRGVVAGGSLDLGSARLNSFDVYGRSQLNNGTTIIKTSFRKAY